MGPRASLRTPATCGTYKTEATLTPWSAPESGPPAQLSDTYRSIEGPGGSACPSGEGSEPNSPSFEAGTEAPVAGAYSPFVLRLHREDGTQAFRSLTVSPPPGLLGRLAGTAYCSEAALKAAEAKSGAEEKASPSCPASSEVGTVEVGAGAGPGPYYTQGKAYLTGPYKGGQLGLAVVTPATAGPFDLGTVVVRSAIDVDPETAQITVKSDEIPTILEGIPLDIRSVVVKLGRPQFTLNPTDCNPMAVNGQESSVFGQVASLTSRFQVGECTALGFKPTLALHLSNGARRAFPALRATVTMPQGNANIASAVVTLPHSEFLEQGHIGTVCTRVQFAANQCPAASVYGKAIAYSPLLDQPLSGPVYLRSSSHELPDLVADLNGQIHVVLDGRIDSVNGGIRSTFEAVPDTPVSKFVLSMRGGAKGLLQNSKSVCAKTRRATASFEAQNGKTADFRPKLNAPCKAPKKSHRRHPRAHPGAGA